MTEPLTPPDCDLQDFPFMPLHVARLRDSDLAAEERPEACWYAVLLWAAAWHQLPAGSLPDNDAVLTKLIGLGRDTRTFKKHRDGALRGFVKCDDGRLYHPIVAEQVLAAWESKKQQRWRSECARIKKANQRNGTENPSPTYEEFLAGVSPAQPVPRPASVPEDTPRCPSGHLLQGTGTGTGISKKEANASSVAEATPKPRDRSYPEAFEAAWKAYPHHKGRSSKPNAVAAWKRLPDAERAGLVGAIQRFTPNVAETCGGKGAPDMAVWLKDGKHLNWGDEEPTAGGTPSFAGPPELRATVVAEKDEDFARRWLDPYCTWRGSDRTLIARNAFVRDRLASELASWAQRMKVHFDVEAANDAPSLLDQTGVAA
jgi:hypothetical protein